MFAKATAFGIAMPYRPSRSHRDRRLGSILRSHPRLQGGTYDFTAAPVTVTKNRAESLLFAESCPNTDFRFLTKKGAPLIETLDDFKGRVFVVNKGAAYDAWARGEDRLESRILRHPDRLHTSRDRRPDLRQCAGDTVVRYAAKSNPQIQLSFRTRPGWSRRSRRARIPATTRGARPGGTWRAA